MAQLIKLDQCLSRYQLDLTAYANRYIQLKQRRWQQWKQAWETGQPEGNVLTKVKGIHSLAALRFKFHHWMFQQQILWATTTSEATSDCPEHFLHDDWLKQCLSQLNDVSLILYNPVVNIKSAPIQLEIIIVTPTSIWCVKRLKGERGSVFQGVSNRKWREITSGEPRDLVNPLISLNRTATIVTSLLKKAGLTAQVRSSLVAPESYIEFVETDQQTIVKDCRDLSAWLLELANHQSTLKHQQLLTAEALLSASHTESNLRN